VPTTIQPPNTKGPSRRQGKIPGLAAVVLLCAASLAGLFASGLLVSGRSFYQLLTENKHLKEAINNLTDEDQIGYAKVISQQTRQGQLHTRLLFVETDRNDPLKRVLEREYEIPGDVIYFDALIVKFTDQLVIDGKERSLYLWRRIYGETMTPHQGLPIEEPGAQPKRYADIAAKLSLRDRKRFWQEIWSLANDPKRLEHAGIKAIEGHALYKELQPGLIYVFKIEPTGDFVCEVVPDL